MRFFKALAIYTAADLLCLFIDLTFSVMDNPLVKAVNAVCSGGIMLIMLISFGLKSAAEDMKQERISGGNTRKYAAQSAAATAFVPLFSWAGLMLSVSGGFEFYRWHKLLNAGFLRVYNVIERSAYSVDLSFAEGLLMLPMAVIPPAVYIVTYILVRKGIIDSE